MNSRRRLRSKNDMAWKKLIFLVVFLANYLQVESRLDHDHDYDEALIASGNVTTELNCSHPVDIAFIVDASGSISAKDYQLQKDFIKKVAEVNQLKDKGAHFGVVLFSDTSSVAIKFNEYFDLEEFKEGVQRMKHEFSITRIDKGLKTAYDQLFTKGYGSRYDVPRVAFLLTDGQQTRRGDFIEPYIAAIPLKEIGIKLIAIGIGSGARRGELETITGDAKAVYMVRNYKRLLDEEMIGKFNYACRPEILQLFTTTEAPTTTSPTTNPSTRLFTTPIETTTAPLAPLIDYYVLIDVTNNRNDDVKFKWMQEGEDKEEIFKAKTRRLKSINISSRRYPLPIVFQAFDAKTNKLLEIRDRANLLLIPRTRKRTEKVQFDPETKEAYINLRIRNRMKDNVTLIWQQLGKRKSILLPKESSLSTEVIFDRSFGIGPVSFRGYTANDKKHPVNLNGKLDKTITPTIIKQVTPLVITKAVRDYQISLNVVNKALGPIEVKWEEDGKPQILQVPFLGRAQRRILLKDQLKAKPIAFSAFIKGTKDSASLDGKNPLYVWPLTFRRVKNVVADKKFYIDFRVTNQVAEDIIVNWKENGVRKSFIIKPGIRGRQNRAFTGPNAKDPVTFTAVTKETNATVKLDGLDVVEVVPRIRRIWTSWTAKKNYYLDLKVENRAADDIVVFWTEGGKQKSIEVAKGKNRIEEMVFEGLDARKKIEFGAVIKGSDHVVQLNGKDQVEFESTPEKKLNVVKAGKKYFLDVEFSNEVAGDIVVSWNEDGKAKSLSIPRGSDDKVNIVLDGPGANNAVSFAAVIKGTDESVDLNGKGIVSFFPSAVPKTKSVYASKYFFLDLEIDNQAPDAIAVRWQTNGAEKNKGIQPGDKGNIRIVSSGVRADDPVQFDAVIKGLDEAVPLNGKSSIAFTPSPKKESKKAVASIYKLQLINKVSGDVTASLQIGQNSQNIKVPYKGSKDTYIDFDSFVGALKLTGINDRNKRKVNLNGSVDFEIVKDEKNKVITVVLESKICDMKVDVIFVIDASGSILPKQYQHQKNFVKKLVDLNAMSKDGLHAGVVLFSQTSSVAIKLNDFFDSKAFAAAVQKVKHECSITRIDKGLKTAYDKLLSKSYGAREGVPKVLFLVTDGKQTRKYNFIEPRVASMPLKKAGVNIKAIGIGRSVDRKELETITGNAKTVYLIRYFNQLVDKKFFETFDFNCDPRNIQPFTSPPGVDPANVPDEDLGPPKDYFIALDVANKLNKPVVVKWKEDGKPKQVDIAKKSKKNVDIKIRKPFYPNPVTFNAVEKDSGKAATLQGRKELDVYPRTNKVVEKIEILPDSGSAYLAFDVKNELDEPIVVKWQEDGEKKSLSVPAKTTQAKELVFDLAKPGALSPKIFKAFTKEDNQPVNINDKKMLTFTPSVEKKKENIVVSSNTEDSYTIIYNINNAKEDVEVAWKQGDINHVIRVPNEDKRYHEIVFDKRKGEVPLTFSAHSFAKGKDYGLALNDSATQTFSPTLTKKVNVLVIGGELKAVDVNFVNNAEGPVVISWLENNREQTQNLGKGEMMKRTIMRPAADADKKLVFTVRRSDADIGARLNDDTSAVFDPSVDKSGKTIVATDVQGYIDINVSNQVAGDIIVKWKENGVEKSLDVKRGKDASNGIVVTGPTVKDPIKFTAVMNETNEKVKLNDLDALEIVPQLSRKAKANSIVASKNFYLDVEIDNQAPDAIAVRWQENGAEKTKDIQPGDKGKIGMVSKGTRADDPVQFDAVIKGTNQEVPLDGRSSVEFTPSPKKETKKAIASIYKLRLINKVSGNVTVRLGIGPDLQNIKVPYKGTKDTYINFDGSLNVMKLSGVNDRNQRKVILNGSVDFTVVRDEKNKVTTVILENKTCDMKVDLIFVIDASGSILPKQYQHQKNFMKKLVDLNAISKDGLHAGVVLFSQTSSVAIKLNDFFDSKAFAAAVQKVKHECSITRIDKGLKTAYDKLLSKSYGAREGVPKVLFLVTDGKQTRKYNFIEPRVASMPLKKAGVNIKAIGIGRSVDRKELETITGNTETVYLIRYFNQLVDKKFFETFDFHCDPRKIQPFKLLPGLEPSEVPDRKDIGPPKDYFIALDVANKLSKPVVVKWKEDGKPKQVDIAKKSKKNVDIKIRKPFFPDPVTFNAVEKDNGRPISLRGRKELDVYPRMERVVEKIELLPDDGSAYLAFDVKNELDEPIVVKWQQGGETKSVSVPAKATDTKELAFDLAKPGALSPKIFKAFTKEGNQPVNINAKKTLTFTPSVEKKKENIVVSPNTEDSYTVIYVINNAKEDVEVAWKRGDICHVIRVPNEDKRYHEIVFDKRKGEVPLTFSAHSYRRGKDFKIALNSSDSHTFSPTLTKKVNTLIVGGKLKSADITFVNNAEGPVVISWLEKGRDKTLQLGVGETVPKSIMRTGEDATKRLVFTARRTDIDMGVRLNDDTTAEYAPSVDTSGKTIVVTDIPRYVVAEFKNEAFSPVEVSWLEKGKKRKLEVKPTKTAGIEVALVSEAALEPLEIKGKYKKYDDPVLMNGLQSISLTPTIDKTKQSVVIKDAPKYVSVDLINKATVPVSFLWKEKGKEQVKSVKPGDKKQQEIVLLGQEAYTPLEITAKRTATDSPVLVNKRDQVFFTPSLSKPLNAVTATYKPNYVIASFINSAAAPIIVSWKRDGVKKTKEVKPGETVQQELVFTDGDTKKQVTFTAVRKDINEPVRLNGAANVKFTVTTNKRLQTAIASDMPRYVLAAFTNNAAGPIVVSWQQDGEKKTREVKPGETAQQELVFIDGDPKKQVTFSAVRKNNNEPVTLNGAANVKFTVTPDKTTQRAIARDVPRYIIAEFTNNAAGPIAVSWQQDGEKKTREFKPGETAQQELLFIDGDPKKQVTFSAVRKNNNEPVTLNGAANLKFTVTPDKTTQRAIARDVPRYIVAEFTNNAAGPIAVSWQQDGEKKTRELKPGETAQQELLFIDGDPKRQVTFSARRNDNNEPVELNGAENVKLTVTSDKRAQKSIVSDIPRYIVADFTNNAAAPIVVSWEQDGEKKTREVKPGKTVRQELLFTDGNPKREVTFTAARKDNNEPVRFNGAESVKLTVTPNKKSQKAIASDIPRYILADFTNNAAAPIVVSWEQDGEKKTREVKPGKTVRQELLFTDGNPKREVTFTAARKDNNEPVRLNGAESVKLTVTPNKKSQKAIASDIPRFIVVDFTNNAAAPIVVSWEQDGEKKTREVKPGETVRQELLFTDGNPKRQMTFTAARKDNNEPVRLNGAESVKLTVTPDKKSQKAIASDIPRFMVADFTNNAAAPIVVSWEQDGEKKTREVKPGETVREELLFTDGNPKQQVTFTAARKDNNEPVRLNGAENVKFTVTSDKRAQKATASDIPRYIVADFTNNAAAPIVVSWEQDGEKKTREVKPGETVREELLFTDGNPKRQMTFTSSRKDNNEPVRLNGAESVKLTVTPDKKSQKAIASDIPRFIVADFTNNAAAPIVVSWEQDGEKKTREVKPGETVREELLFTDGNPKQQVTFTAARKNNNEPVRLNDAENVKFTVTSDKRAQKATASDIPRYILADFTNNAAAPIVVSWEQDGEKKTREVKPGETVRQELLFTDANPKREVTFTAARKDNNEPVRLNGAESVKLTVTPDKKSQKAIASDVPRFIVADFTNNAAAPIVVSWEQDGEKKTREVKPGETVRQELLFTDGNPKRQMTFTAARKDNNEPVRLNGAESVKLTVTPDKKSQKAIASDIPRFMVADFTNNAAAPIVVSWEQDGEKKTREVKPGETVREELLFTDGNPKQQVTFTAARKDNNEPVRLNGAENVKFTVTSDKRAQKATASDIPRYIVADFTNNAAAPIVVSWEQDGEKKTREVKPVETVREELLFTDGNPKQQVTFTAARKNNNEPVRLNDAENVKFTVTSDKRAQKATASDIPRYILADFTNNAAAPIVVSWEQDGEKKTREVKPGETVRQELLFTDANPKREVTFTAARKDNNEPVRLNGAESVKLTVTPDKKSQKAIASDVPRFIVADFTNNAAAPIVVSWEQDGEKKTREVKPRETVRQELLFTDGNPKRQVTFTAARKDNNEPVRLNGAESVKLSATPDKKSQKAIASDIPRFIVADFTNNAAAPIVVSWEQDGEKKTREVKPGETVREELLFTDGNPDRAVTFTAARKDDNEPVRLNGAENVKFTVTSDKRAQKATASDIPRYILADFTNNAAAPIVVSWEQDGEKKTREVKPGETVRQELLFTDANPKREVTFTAARKDNNEPVRLNGAESVKLTVTPDKKSQKAIASDIPRFIVADFTNNAAAPIVVSWEQDGEKKTREVKPRETVRQELLFTDGNPKRQVTFTAARKDNNEPVRLNGAESVKLSATPDKKSQKAIASDIPRFIVADFTNNAAAPIVVSWEQDGEKKTREVKPGETVREELLFTDGNPDRAVTFTASRKDNNEPVRLNGAENVKFTVTSDKKAQKAIASDIPRYIVADFTNNAAAPIVVSWEQDGEKKTREVKPGETVRQELLFTDGNPKREVTFTAARKDNNEPVRLNGAESVKLSATPDKKSQKAIASDIPRFIVADFTNNAAAPIVVSWEQDGEKKTREVKQGETVRQELLFTDGNPKRQMTFTSSRKDNNEPVRLNGAENVKFTVTSDKKAQKAIASDIPRYIVADFTNNAAAPIVVSWEQDGEKKTREVKPGETVREELLFTDGNPKRQMTFTSSRKDNNEPVRLNGAESVKLTVTPDKKSQKAIASDIPRFIVADFTNNAAAPIVVSWEQDGEKKTREVKPGETVRQELLFTDGNPKRQMTFTAARKYNNEPVRLNGAESVKLTVTPDKKSQKAIASDIPRFIVADFTNNAAAPIVVSWEQDGEKKTREVKPGETVREELIFTDSNPKRQVTFTAARKDDNEPVRLNGAENVKFTVTSDKKSQKAIVSDIPRYIVADFTNNAAAPIAVSWEQDGEKKTREVKPGETVREELLFTNGNPNRAVTFTATRKDNNEPVRLNGAENVKFTVTSDKKAQKAIASDILRYIVADFTNNAAAPIVVSWEHDGEKKTTEVKPGETVRQELLFTDGNPKREVTFSARRKDNNEPVKLNDAENVRFAVTRDKRSQRAVASNVPLYIVADFINNAAGPIVVSWDQDGEKRTSDVKRGVTVRQELFFKDGNPKRAVTFTAMRKDNNEAVKLNGGANVRFSVTPDKNPLRAIASDVPRYIVADFINNAAGPILVSWEQDGEKKTREVKPGETVQQVLVLIDGNPKRSVTFTARRKDNNQPVNLNGAENVRFTVTPAKKAQKAVASDIPMYIIADFTNNAAGPIIASWEHDGAKKTKDIKRGETAREELVFVDGDPKKEVTFMAVNKDNNKAVWLNGAENVKFTVTTDKTPQKAVATNPKLYAIVEFINQAAGPVDVSWSVIGVKRSLTVPLGKTVREKLIFNDGLYSRNVVFSGLRKNSGDAVMLNKLEKASIHVRDDQSVRSIILTDYPRYVSVDIANNADSAILVSWLEGWSSRSLVIEPSRSAQREIVFKNADVSSSVTFSGKLKDSDQDIKLNGLPSVTVLPTVTKAVSEIIATNVPVTINIEFVNKALGPVVFSWLENGVPKTLDVERNGSKKKSITLKGLAAEMPLIFTGTRKYFDFSVKVNNAENVQYTALADKGNQRIVASDQVLLIPFFDEGWKSAADVGTRRYLIVDVINKANGPIRFTSSRDGQEIFVNVAGGETRRIALVFQGLDDTKPVLFYGKRLDFGIPVRVNDGKVVELRPTLDKNKVKKIVVTDERLVMPWLQPAGLISPGAITSPGNVRYVTVDLVNQAQGPIIISTSRGSRKQDFSLSPGETKKTTFVVNGQNEKPVLFVGRRTDTKAPVSLNYDQEVLFIPRKEKVTETVIARDQPKYVAVDFINDAGGPVSISWVLDGRKDSLELAPKRSTLKRLNPSFKTKNVVFTAARTDMGVPVKLNKADSVTFVPTYDRSIIETVTATDSPQYIVADLINKADGPAEFSWIENGETIKQIVGKGQTVQRTTIFKYVTGKQQVSFTAKRKDLNFPILVNDVKSVEIVPSFEKIVKKVVATDIKLILPWFDEGWKSITDVGIRRYLEVDIRNNAFGPIVVTTARGGVKKTVDIAAGKASSIAMIFQGPRSADPVTFTATRKDTGAVVHLNGDASVQFSPRFERFTENVIAVDAPKYLSVEITNNAFGPITVSWVQNGVQASAEVRPGKTVRRDMVFKGANSDKPVVFTGVISGTKDSIILNDASNVQFTPSYDRTVQPIVARSREISRYLVIIFNNQGSGPGVVSWLENGGTQRSLEIPKGQTVRRELVFSNGDAFKKIKFTAKRRDNRHPMTLNDVREFQLVPSTNKNPEQVVLSDSPRYLDIVFRNNAPGSIYISWLQNGVKKQLTMQKGQSEPLSFVSPAQEGNMPFVFSSKFVSLPGIVYLNNLSPISYAPSFVKSQPHVVTATSPHVDVSFINTAQRPATVKWIELESPKQLTIPAGKAVRQLIFFESSKDSTVLTGSLESNSRKFVAQLNAVDSLRMQEDAANLRRNVRITEGNRIYFFGMNLINKMDIDARVQYRFNGDNGAVYRLTVPAKSTRRKLEEYGKVERVTVGAVRADTSKRVYINNNAFMMYNSLPTQFYNDLVITQEPKYRLELKIINKLPQDTTLNWIHHGIGKEIIVPRSSTVEKVIVYEHTDHPFDFRAFVKGTKILAKVNHKRSLIYSHRDVPKQVLELIIDSEHYLGINVVNIRRSDSLLLWNELGVNKSLAVGPVSSARKMIVIHRAGLQDPIDFTAVDRINGKPLPVNRKRVVSFRPSLRKKYELIRISAYKDPNTFYVMFDVRNRARDDAIIRWSVNGVKNTKDCPQLRRCSIFIRLRDPTGSPKPVGFTAIIKANGKALHLNKQSLMEVQPRRYQKIVNAVIENKEEVTDTRVVNVDASSMQQSPMIIRFAYNGQTGSFRLDGFAQKKYEIIIKMPQPTTKVLFTAVDAQTGEAMKVNEKESYTYSTTAFKSNVLLLAGGKVVPPEQVKELEPTVHECQDRHVDVLFIIDNSGTMEFAFKLARLFAKKIMALFRLSDSGTRASVITIAGPEDTNLVIRFSDFYNQNLFNTAIDRLRFASGKTRIDKALDIATNEAFKVENGGRPSYPKLVFFISDGRQVPAVVNGRYVNLMRRSYQLRRMATNIVSIAVSGERPVDVGSLQMISWKRDNVYLPGRLDDIVKDIFVKHIFNKYCKV